MREAQLPQGDRNAYKIRAFQKAMDVLKLVDVPITSVEQIQHVSNFIFRLLDFCKKHEDNVDLIGHF